MSCPICKKASVSKYKPFCSKRCADVDLSKWLGGDYAVPAADQEAVEEALLQAGEKNFPIQ